MGQSLPLIKVPKWPFWTAHSLLFSYGCYVALFSERPLDSAAIFGPLLSVFMGGILLAIPYLIELFSQQNAVKSNTAQAGQTVNFAVNRIEQSVERLALVESEVEKTVQGTQDILQLIEEKLLVLRETLVEKESAELEKLRLELDRLRSETASLRLMNTEQVTAVANGISQLPDNMGEIFPLLDTIDKHQQNIGLRQISLASNIRDLETKFETIQGQFQAQSALLEELRSLPDTLTSLLANKATHPVATPPKASPTTEDTTATVADSESSIPSADTPDEPTSPTEAVHHTGDIADSTKSDPQPAPQSPPTQAQPTLFNDPEPLADGRTTLLVEALIGVTNQLYLRGDAPGLTWDKGIPMELVGIGRWQWHSEEVTAPVNIHVYRNDKIPADGGPITLKPGKSHTLRPVFPKEQPRPQW